MIQISLACQLDIFPIKFFHTPFCKQQLVFSLEARFMYKLNSLVTIKYLFGLNLMGSFVLEIREDFS